MENIREALDGFALFDPNWHSPHMPGRVGLTCTLFFRGGHLPEVRENVYECIREYREILGDRARCCLLPPGRVVRAGKKGLPPGTSPAGRVGLMCLLHFRGGHLAAVQEGLCECIREYARLSDNMARCGKIAAGRVMLAGARGLTLPDQARIR